MCVMEVTTHTTCMCCIAPTDWRWYALGGQCFPHFLGGESLVS